MAQPQANPRILVITPEVTYLPRGMGNIANFLSAKAGGLADVSAALIAALFEQGADVHIAIPDYRSLFSNSLPNPLKRSIRRLKRLPEERIHLAEDRSFFYVNAIYSGYEHDNAKISLAFQREVINNILPRVQPDLIHCNDWMTGLIPAVARHHGIPCLFTIHNIHTVKNTLAYIEDMGIDAAEFWSGLYYESFAVDYESTRAFNSVDFLASGVFAAHFVNTVSPTFLLEMVEGWHDFVTPQLREELTNKWKAGCATGILNTPDPAYNPVTDKNLPNNYGPKRHAEQKRKNKIVLQKALGLEVDENAPILFWPSRLDVVQKGCELLAQICYRVISTFWEQNLEIVFVANGDYKVHFEAIARFHDLKKRMAICDFTEGLSRLAFGSSDFVLMPSRFEPCGLPQMIGCIYGTLPIVHDTGGLHDTISHLDVDENKGNGFLFETYDANGLFWAIEQAMQFYNLAPEVKADQIERTMNHAASTFNHAVTARRYIDLYEKMLKRPLICNE